MTAPFEGCVRTYLVEYRLKYLRPAINNITKPAPRVDASKLVKQAVAVLFRRSREKVWKEFTSNKSWEL